MSRSAVKASSVPSSPEVAPSFEEAMGELESIVQAMDDDTLPLESLLTQYSRGKHLLKFCQTQIQNAQQRVESINAQSDGTTSLEPFEPSALPPPPSPSRSSGRSPASPVSDSEDDIQFS